jgi:thiazole synthase
MVHDDTLSIRVNGEHRRVAKGMTIAALANELGLDPDKVAVERNLEVVPRSTLARTPVEDGDDFEIVTFVGGGDHAGFQSDSWTVAGRSFRSRLIVGTGKYRDFAQNAAAVEA